MRRLMLSKGFVAGCGLAVALSAGACAEDGDRSVMDEGTTSDQSREADAGHEGAPITLTGCLQKGDGSSFVITQVNEPSSSVGESGAGAQREQMRAARQAYELEGDDDDRFAELVGRQVRVTGTIAENSNLNREGSIGDREVGTTGDRNRTGADTDNRDRSELDIDANDLAKVDVQSIAQVADACGESAPAK